MKFIKLHIQNFQSHKDTIITFSNGLNIIIGPTDTGKSAILRALRKLIRDDPNGKAFISKWSKDMTITLTFEKGSIEYTVCRRITPSKNLYSLDAEEYGGFGKTIPEEIQNALNMTLVELETGDELDLHFSDQHDLPFMVSKGQAGTRSKLLGRIAGLHVLDRAITRVNSDIRAENTTLKHKDQEKDNLQYALEDWPDLWHELEIITTLAEKIKIVKANQTRHEEISRTYTKLLQIQDEAKDVKYMLDFIPVVHVSFKRITGRAQKYQNLTKTYQKLIECIDSIEKLNSLTPPEIKVDFEGIKDRITRLNKLNEIFTKLTTITGDALSVNEKEIVTQLQTSIEEHAAVLKELGICPTCKKPVHGKDDETCTI